ncbi:spore coat protein [Paenibacillus doosanensis]|uniref:Coat F domain protein n=1 Tax=Paenibacillus konkukensis TaxID=2020716 RepID=A0ABY4RYF4_9BACL|nr:MULTISPECIES: spore coat protein [Paenibacillus]MCS7459404.1 spore coat protein [Paenibacillus doosanensis]UQZ87197.1 Coat F domain protein [Paenibacillus konkukensis]
MPTMEIAKPQSGELPQVKGPEMNDRDRVNDILSMQKYLTTGFNTGLSEVQNPQLRKSVASILTAQQEAQWELFNLMFEKGWYKMKAADKQEISQAKQQFSGYSSQFPSFS